MIPQEFQTAMYAAVSGMVIAGIVKLFNKFVESNSADLETHVALRKELREELDTVKTELRFIQTELDNWKLKYFDQVQLTNELKLELISLGDELREYKQSTEWTAIKLDPPLDT
jgi:hypothetical protein